MDKKKSIINIQDLDISAASQHSASGQWKLHAIFRKKILFLEYLIIRRKNLLLESFSGYRRAADTLNESPKSFKKSRYKRFVRN